MFVAAGVLTVVQGAIIGFALPRWPALIAVGVAAPPLGTDWFNGLGHLQRIYLKVV